MVGSVDDQKRAEMLRGKGQELEINSKQAFSNFLNWTFPSQAGSLISDAQGKLQVFKNRIQDELKDEKHLKRLFIEAAKKVRDENIQERIKYKKLSRQQQAMQPEPKDLGIKDDSEISKLADNLTFGEDGSFSQDAIKGLFKTSDKEEGYNKIKAKFDQLTEERVKEWYDEYQKEWAGDYYKHWTQDKFGPAFTTVGLVEGAMTGGAAGAAGFLFGHLALYAKTKAMGWTAESVGDNVLKKRKAEAEKDNSKKARVRTYEDKKIIRTENEGELSAERDSKLVANPLVANPLYDSARSNSTVSMELGEGKY